MKISHLDLKSFMIFNHLDMSFSPNINVISGENSTGKTALIKLLYACIKSGEKAYLSKGDFTVEKLDSILVSKLQGVFRPDKDSVGRLVNRRQGSNSAEIHIEFDNHDDFDISFNNRHTKHINIEKHPASNYKSNAVYIPPKEIISSTENFVSLYDDYHIAFEETYYDLARLLEKPLKKGANTSEQNAVLERFEDIVDGNIVKKDRVFYLKVKGSGEFEMGLVSEGYRKLVTIMYLILSGSLNKNSILFWDEPETNMNPKMIQPVVEALIALANLGVQVFVTTHDYFIQQSFNLAATYPNPQNKPLQYQFISLYQSKDGIQAESVNELSDLTHNAIMEEFDALYDREQNLIYGD
jgi:predicted ATP-dependent endonuclease of OLD family